MSRREIVLCNSVRTVIRTYYGSLKIGSGDRAGRDGGARRVDALQAQRRGDRYCRDGKCHQAGNKMNPAWQSAVNGGIPVDIPAMTINQVCGSGAQAVASAAQELMLGMVDSAVAGGTENMERGAVPGCEQPLGLSHGRCADVR